MLLDGDACFLIPSEALIDFQLSSEEATRLQQQLAEITRFSMLTAVASSELGLDQPEVPQGVGGAGRGRQAIRGSVCTIHLERFVQVVNQGCDAGAPCRPNMANFAGPPPGREVVDR